jgi:hypothetical protein
VVALLLLLLVLLLLLLVESKVESDGFARKQES